MNGLLRIALYALALLMLAPATAGLIDAWCWTMFGSQATSIEWSDVRFWIAWALLIPGLPAALAALTEW